MTVIVVHDAIHANIGHLPPGLAAGYTTGTPDIAWTVNDWITHPGAVRICQDSGTDHTADVLDVEQGAATYSDAPRWFKVADQVYRTAGRPGQRSPAVYASASSITTLVNALISGGVTSGCGLWVANWNLTQPQAYADVVNAAGPFPIIGVQWASGATTDVSVFSGAWLNRVSAQGQFSHLTDGTTSLGQIAANRGMKVEAWVTEQETMHPADGTNLVAASVPPAGMRWWSVHQ